MPVTITISINDSQVRSLNDIQWHSGMNVQDAMETAYGTSPGYGFVLQYFGKDLGYEAVAIDGILSQSGTDEYLFWQLSIDGVIADKGIDETILKDGDEVEWDYTRYVEQTHRGTRYSALKAITKGGA